MIQALVLLPALGGLSVAWRHGAARAFIFIVWPACLLLPSYYATKLPGVPLVNFHGYALLLVGGLYCWAHRAARPAWHIADALLILFVVWCACAEYMLKDYGQAQNRLAVLVMACAAPYAVGRWVARRDGHLWALLLVTVIVGAFIGIVSPWEARMGSNPFDFWRSIWPTSVPWSGALYRSGLRRVAGPFGHPIFCGLFFSLVIPIGVWALRRACDMPKWVRWGMLAALVLGLLLSLSRGPIVGASIAVAVALMGRSKSRGQAFTWATLLVVILAALSADKIHTYVTIRRGDARTEAQESAAYRNEMLGRYVEIVEQKPLMGWGKNQIPVVKNLKSIDNQFLYLSLIHGYPASILWLLLTLVPCCALVRRLRAQPGTHPHPDLGWALVGALVGTLFTQVTVVAGTQTPVVLTMLMGISVTLAQRLPGPNDPSRWPRAQADRRGQAPSPIT